MIAAVTHRDIDKAWLVRQDAENGLIRLNRGALGCPKERAELEWRREICTRVIRRYTRYS